MQSNNMNFSPIVLFVYNRPVHTQKTVEALKSNTLADESELFIYSDGPKNQSDTKNVEEVREYIKTIQGFNSVKIIEKEKNSGLANSIISGVTEIINRYQKAIVLEDDLTTSPYFLKFMNQALEFYREYKKVFAVSGYLPPVEVSKNHLSDVFFSYRSTSWGWATWKDRWQKIDWQVSDFDEFIKSKELVKKFNRAGNNLTSMLKAQMQGKIDSWAIRRTYSQFKCNSYTVFPRVSLIRNIGLDGTGVHCGRSKQLAISEEEVLKKEMDFKFSKDIFVDQEINKKFKKLYSDNITKKIKKYLRKILK